MTGWVYILQCSDGTYYTGSTNNMELRLAEHENGEGSVYTINRLPIKMVYCEECQNILDAFLREKQVQGWSRKKKEALIQGDANSLPKFSVAYKDKNI